RRAFSRDIVEEYKLGASAPGWDKFARIAAHEGIPGPILEKSGLAIPRDTGGGYYDRFRGRLMFPIHAPGGRPIGFGGRVLDGTEPKYLNSPETPLFRKRKTLYGIPQATAALRENRTAILVEGYTDVLTLATHGFRGALAALGTAFTADHAAWLKRSCDRVTVLFDGDAAGRKAAESSVGPLLAEGLSLSLVMLPAGEDPDSLLRNEGPEAFARRLEQGGDPIDVLLGDDAYEGGAATERAVRRALEALTPVSDAIRRRVLLQEVSMRVAVPTDLLEEQLAEMRKRSAASEKRIAERERSREASLGRAGVRAPGPAAKVRKASPGRGRGPDTGFDPGPETDLPDFLEESSELPEELAVSFGPPPPVELTFLGLVLHDEVHGERLLERFGPADFEHAVTRRIAEKAWEMSSHGRAITAASLLEAFAGDPAARELLGELAMDSMYATHGEVAAHDVAIKIEARALQREMGRVDTELRRAKAKGDLAQLVELVSRKAELARAYARLNAPTGSPR
ncbi:MAG: toprim domain-containing protein, partial [Gemmatimonadetes bacterium]|nr:toprim domain-containing protein [Gemmatimonadota bacterium]